MTRPLWTFPALAITLALALATPPSLAQEPASDPVQDPAAVLEAPVTPGSDIPTFPPDKPPALAFGQSVEGVPDDALPFVYTEWKHYTLADGLPNDHIFAVKPDGPRVWIGTENGLACLDRRTGKIRSWTEEDGLPFPAVVAIDVDPKTGDVWLGLFGGGLARFSGGRFDHFNQLNSGLVNDVVYGVAIEHDNVWAATTAGASRFNTRTNEWSIYTEKNAPMEEIWNYSVQYDPKSNKIYLGVWGSGCLEFDVATERWKHYLDPDGEMEIDLYRDDGIVHVIVTGATSIDDTLWISTYFGNCRYDGRHWRGFYAHETGWLSDFTNVVKGRSATEGWFGLDKGVGVVADFPTDTCVSYTQDPDTGKGVARVTRNGRVLKTYETERGLPHNYVINLEFDGDDVWVATGKGLGHGIGTGRYTGLRRPGETQPFVPPQAQPQPSQEPQP